MMEDKDLLLTYFKNKVKQTNDSLNLNMDESEIEYMSRRLMYDMLQEINNYIELNIRIYNNHI